MKSKTTAWAIGFLCALVFSALMGYLLYDSLLPMFVAFGLAYAFSPVVDYLERKKVPRAWGVAILMVGLAVVISVLVASLIPPLVRDAKEFVAGFPDYFSTAVQKLNALGREYGVRLPLEEELTQKVRDKMRGLSFSALSPVMIFAKRVFTGVADVAVTVLNFLIVPVFFFYFLRDLPAIQGYAFDLIPKGYRPAAQDRLEKIDRVFSGYIRGQMLVALILAGIFSMGLLVLGVKFGLFIGILAGLLNIIPYLGQLTGLLLSLTMALVDFQGWPRFLAIPALFALTNFVEGTFLTPKIVGDKVGLTPVQAILALIIGGEVAGLVGLIVAIPAAGSLKVLLRDVIARYRKSHLYNDTSRRSLP